MFSVVSVRHSVRGGRYSVEAHLCTGPYNPQNMFSLDLAVTNIDPPAHITLLRHAFDLTLQGPHSPIPPRQVQTCLL